MTRTLIYSALSMSLIVFAWWAYKENYLTQNRQDVVEEMQSAHSERFFYLQYLNAEWAHLTRAERLIALVENNFDHVMLGPMTKVNLAKVETIPYAKEGQALYSLLSPPDPSGAGRGFRPR